MDGALKRHPFTGSTLLRPRKLRSARLSIHIRWRCCATVFRALPSGPQADVSFGGEAICCDRGPKDLLREGAVKWVAPHRPGP